MVDGIRLSRLYDCFALAIKDALEVINQMQADGVISKYAIGGAVGATFYVQTGSTEDLDVFIDVPTSIGSPLVSLAPIYKYLSARDCSPEGPFIKIAGWPVQFLPISNELQREALAQAVSIDLQKTPTRVFGPEYLVAIALETGRLKDHLRILQFIEQNAVDDAKLDTLLSRFGLRDKWTTLRKRLQ